jgi:hypothetical protein
MSPPLPTVARAVSVRGDVIVKIQEPAASRRERLRTLAGRDVGRRTGLFTVPEIVSFDDAAGEIVFERLNLVGLQKALSDRNRSRELVGRAAKVLAAVHGRMEPPEPVASTEPGKGIATEREPVPLHGDFGVFNILFLADSDRMVIIDWANADWIGLEADLGAPEIDIAVFLISLFHRRPFGPWRVSRRHELARHFLATYASVGPRGLDIGSLRAVVSSITPAFVQVTRRLRGNMRALAYRPGLIDLGLFLRGLAPQGFAGTRHSHTG